MAKKFDFTAQKTGLLQLMLNVYDQEPQDVDMEQVEAMGYTTVREFQEDMLRQIREEIERRSTEG
jgi:tRNA splicing ligase